MNTPLESTMNGKANLSGATFSGDVTTQNLNVQGSMTGATGYFTSITTNYLKTAAEVDTGYLTVSGTGSFGSLSCTGGVSTSTLTAANQITAKYPVCISFYGSPTTYNTSGTLQTSGFTTLNQVFNLLFSTYTNQNWTPTYTSSVKLAVPYTGLYALQFTFSSNSTNSVFQFISKNMGNGNETNPVVNDDLIATSSVGNDSK